MVDEKTCLKNSNKSSFNPYSKERTFKSLIWDYLEGDIDSPLEYFLLFLIFGNVVLLCLSTIVLDEDCFGDDCLRLGDEDSPYGYIFNQLEFFSVCVFTLEYSQFVPYRGSHAPIGPRIYRDDYLQCT